MATLTAQQHKQKTLDMAGLIFKMISDPKVVRGTTHEQRHEMLLEHQNQFCAAYPLVAAKMALNLQYNEDAFRSTLDYIDTRPGKGMEGVMQSQSFYAQHLYINEAKAAGRHWSRKQANVIRQMEYDAMKKWVRGVLKTKREVKADVEREQEQFTRERKKALAELDCSGDDASADAVAEALALAAELATESSDHSAALSKAVRTGKPVESTSLTDSSVPGQQRRGLDARSRVQAFDAAERAAYLQDSNCKRFRR